MSEHPPDRHPGRFLGHTTARHRIGQPVLLFAKVQKLKPVKPNFIVYFSSICMYFTSGCAGDTGLYAPKMSVHLPDPRPSRFFGRTCARHRIGQPVLLFANVQKLKPVKNNFIVYFSSICQYFSSGCAGDTGLYAPKMLVHLPDPGPSRSSGRTTARQRIGQPVLLFAKVPENFR